MPSLKVFFLKQVQDWCYYLFMDSSIIDKNRLQIRRFGKEKEEQTCKNAKYLFQYRLAVVYSEFGFVRLRKACGGNLPIEKIPEMTLLMEKTMYLGYPMRKHLPYRRIFSMKIGQMKNAGLIQYCIFKQYSEQITINEELKREVGILKSQKNKNEHKKLNKNMIIHDVPYEDNENIKSIIEKNKCGTTDRLVERSIYSF
ncbi:hypothetical protein WA026_015444 [Henosepilachna vigintioctopunctata]|uniref:Uncharacterized protein n=1 Tax=Henosepilachna vigintioctopunctata TaxID=420089 RepID=A0AAW1UF78_9CUCU